MSQKDFRWLIGPALLILTPFFGLPGIMDMREAQMNFIQCGIYLWFLFFFPKPIGIFLGYCLAHFFVFNSPEAAKMFQMITLAAGFFLMVRNTSKTHAKEWIICLCLFSVLNTLVVIMQMRGIQLKIDLFCFVISYTEGPERLGYDMWIGHNGIMGQRVFSGTLSAMTAPLFCFFNPFLSLIPLIALKESVCTAAVAGFVPAILISYFVSSKKFFYFSSVVILITAFIFLRKDFNPGMHFEVLKFTFPLIKNHIFGNGLGSFSELNLSWPKASMIFKEAHNETFQIFFEYGFIGIYLFWKIIKDVSVKFRQFYSDKALAVLFSALLAFYIASFGQPTFHVVRIAMPAIAVLALFYSRYENLKGSTP